MPSRTYIQMLLKLYSKGKIFLTKESLQKLNKYNNVLENHPEDIEKVVKQRVNMLKYTKDIRPDIDVMIIHMVMFEEIILESMFMAELIELPKFNDFDIIPKFNPNLNRLAMFYPLVTSNAVITIDNGGKNENS